MNRIGRPFGLPVSTRWSCVPPPPTILRLFIIASCYSVLGFQTRVFTIRPFGQLSILFLLELLPELLELLFQILDFFFKLADSIELGFRFGECHFTGKKMRITNFLLPCLPRQANDERRLA